MSGNINAIVIIGDDSLVEGNIYHGEPTDIDSVDFNSVSFIDVTGDNNLIINNKGERIVAVGDVGSGEYGVNFVGDDNIVANNNMNTKWFYCFRSVGDRNTIIGNNGYDSTYGLHVVSGNNKNTAVNNIFTGSTWNLRDQGTGTFYRLATSNDALNNF